ncbi:thioredoxin [Rhodopseudomonas faecalis]|uniref:Thioredoxin n=1 Tax=Rhodopseudomonas faecalis TaxID=99655 RepID=A0A318TBA1_9BRAD|nr:thioredoxin TrxC [Rhodopseudomonas faecalis]PYF01934.1 thioredoxin [Rhodopseudomonas faecalis]
MDQLIVCPHCGATNRLPDGRPASAAKCGKCGVALFGGHPADVSAAIFSRHIERSTIPVLVDVWAPWCAPCRMMAPAFAAAAAELEPQVRLVKLNSDVEQAVAAQLGISGIPTLLLFRGGREIARQSGAMSARQIVQWTKQHL